jgi:hypothetical protein
LKCGVNARQRGVPLREVIDPRAAYRAQAGTKAIVCPLKKMHGYHQ